jgi:membrane protein
MWDIPAEQPPEGGAWEHAKWSLSALGRANLAAFLILLACGGLLVASLMVSAIVGLAAQWIAPVLEVTPSTLRAVEMASSIVLVTVLFAIVYRYLPRTTVGWRDVWVGAVATAALFVLGRVLLGVYFAYASPGSAYGAAGSVVALLIWTNLSLQLLLLGAEFTHAYAYTYGTRATP